MLFGSGRAIAFIDINPDPIHDIIMDDAEQTQPLLNLRTCNVHRLNKKNKHSGINIFENSANFVTPDVSVFFSPWLIIYQMDLIDNLLS